MGENPLGEEMSGGRGRRNPLEEQSPTFSVPGMGFVEDSLSMDQGGGMV